MTTTVRIKKLQEEIRQKNCEHLEKEIGWKTEVLGIRETELSHKDDMITVLKTVIGSRDARTEFLEAQLKSKDDRIAFLEEQIRKKDVMIMDISQKDAAIRNLEENLRVKMVDMRSEMNHLETSMGRIEILEKKLNQQDAQN